jgi:hypothetical protein
MIEPKDIFVWYRDLPRVPGDATIVQVDEWRRKNAPLFARSFVGERLTGCYAGVFQIDQNAITAYADYQLDYLVFHDGRHYHHEPNTARRHYAQIQYTITYDQRRFQSVIQKASIGQAIEFEGIITEARWHATDTVRVDSAGGRLAVHLSLESIKLAERRFLHAELLDSRLRYDRSRRVRECFIATAAFESTEAAEVVVLRRFRDEVLTQTPTGAALIRMYELLSPSVAATIRLVPVLRMAVRQFLSSIVLPVVVQLMRRNRQRSPHAVD